MKPILFEVLECCKHLITELGLEIEEHSAWPEPFGDGLVTFRSTTMKLRVIRDRGQVFVAVTAPALAASWLSFHTVLQMLVDDGEEFAHDELELFEPGGEALRNLEVSLKTLLRHKDSIVRLLDARNYERTVGRARQLKGVRH